jgi:hypothetical protein
LAANQELRPLAELVEQGERFIKRAELARSGQGGHNTTFRVARYLLNDLALPYEEVRRLLGLYNQRLEEEGEEPWSEAELDHKLESAAGDNPDFPYACKAVRTIVAPVDNPHRLAKSFLSETRWAFWNSLYFRFDGRRYVELSESEVIALLTGHIKECFEADHAEKLGKYEKALQLYDEESDARPRKPRKPKLLAVKRSILQDAMLALKSLTMLSGNTPMPSWLNGRGGNWLAFRNGLLDIDSRQLQPHSLQWFSTVCLPYD